MEANALYDDMTLFAQARIGYLRRVAVTYTTEMRPEYATEMLRSHPHYAVDSIAGECGMTPTTFYRLFSRRYGMTPAEYREAELSNLYEKPENEDDDES